MNEPLGPSAQSNERTVFEFARAASIEGWWWWALLILFFAAVLYTCVRFYRRDALELPRSVSTTLTFLRVVTLVSLIFFFFDFGRRTQREIVRPSEVVVLVDTSQSMSLPATDLAAGQSRSERAAQIVSESKLLDRLSLEHRVSVYGFGATAEPALLEASDIEQADETYDQSATADDSSQRSISVLALAGMTLLVLALVLSTASFAVGIGLSPTADAQQGAPGERLGWLLGMTAFAMCAGILLCGSAYMSETEKPFFALIGLGNETLTLDDRQDENADDETPEPIKVLDWNQAVSAAASQSRIGDAIAAVLASHDPTTLAGVVLLTDGQNNGGKSIASVLSNARQSEVSLYPVGLGSSRPPTNVRVVDLDAPKRVYPNDKFTVSAVLQATGGKNLEVTVDLFDELDKPEFDINDPQRLPKTKIDSKKLTLDGDGELSGIEFELEPKTVGRRCLAIEIQWDGAAADQNQEDDAQGARYEVVARKLRVLTIAGGPTREYRFVRNLLFREKSIRLDTWLQSGGPGISQDANAIIDQFPSTAQELFEYDAIIMFDPDWTGISSESLVLLDRWVASQAGGLAIIAGPVYHPRWLRLRTDPRVQQIAGFFPVSFSSRGLVMGTGRRGGETAWPLEFTAESRRADFLWLTDQPQTSFEVWESFGGVYDYVGVKSAKPVAKVYAYFSDPTTRVSDSLPVYLASQFYGAGRVYFQGSGEMWRLRRESDAYFDSYYTKLVRWISEGRLLRDSNRGVLLVDNPRAMVGDTITVRAVLTDEQYEPLTVPEVKAKLLTPDGTISDVRLSQVKDEERQGTYSGRFLVRKSGNHQLRLSIGDALNEVLFRQKRSGQFAYN